MLIQEVSDPRLEGITITDVRIDRELAYADIYVSTWEGSGRSQEILDGLEHAQGFLRRELTQRIELRSFPRLRFHWDPTFEKAERIERLIASLHSQENLPEGDENQPDERNSASSNSRSIG
jgi:ribosome-binding factor A